MYEKRIGNVLGEMKKRGLSQLVVSDPMAIWYLTGIGIEPYERLYALLLREDGKHALFLNLMFGERETDIGKVWYTDTDDPVALVAERVDPAKPLGVDKDWPARFLVPLMDRFPGLEVRLGSDCVDDVRACKDETEQALMRRASEINDKACARAAASLRVGDTEKEVADRIRSYYKEEGSEEPSFTLIVSFGDHAADPHHKPDDTKLKPGDCVLFDIGCKWKRYCSDMTRTYFCRKADPKYAAIHDLVRSANEKAESMIRPGVKLCELDKAARDLITEAGYGKYFTHRLGHFIGVTDHEKGDVSLTTPLVAKEGMIFSIEPGVYLPGEFGVRVEDLVLVTKDGFERLNHLDKHWSLVGCE